MTHMSANLYLLEEVTRSFSTGFSLYLPNLEIEEGKTLGITGPNGSGKSTLLHLLAFLIPPDSGKINCAIPPEERDTAITMMLQDHYLLKRSVHGNVSYGLKIRGAGGISRRVERTLESLGLNPGTFSRRRWNELSGGEARRVSLAARLVLNPRVLILDEPVANIDRHSTHLITEAIRQIQAGNNTTVVISSHDRQWLSAVSDRVLNLEGGAMTGFVTENRLPGPWVRGEDGLWCSYLPDGEKVYAAVGPGEASTGIIEPGSILISTDSAGQSTARNTLEGKITAMREGPDQGIVLVEARSHGNDFHVHVTRHSVAQLGLVPGMRVFLIFKASSISWV